jgi:hypothetical protein
VFLANSNLEQSKGEVCPGAESVTLRFCVCGCGEPLDDRRADAKTATPACRKRLERGQARKRLFHREALKRQRTHCFLAFDGQYSGLSKLLKELKVDSFRNKFSRCAYCHANFTDSDNRPIVREFAFCNESKFKDGPCKAAWIAAHPNVSVPTTPFIEKSGHIEGRYAQPVNPHAHPLLIGPKLKNGFFQSQTYHTARQFQSVEVRR